MNKEQIVKEFVNAVNKLRATKENATYYWKLHTGRNNMVYALVLGWSRGFDDIDKAFREDNECLDGEYGICAKLACQSVGSAMQYDYDIDWQYPIGADGEESVREFDIWDSDNFETVANWILDYYNKYHAKD